MKKLLLTSLLLMLAACAATSSPPDKFTSIAEEWQGGYIQDMIRQWGNPKTLQQATADGADGVAHWMYAFGGGGPNYAGGPGRSRCEATAYFSSSGFISDIEVVSKKCNMSWLNKDLERMRRP